MSRCLFTKSGYTISLSGVSGTPASSYQFIADPIVANQTGVRHFCSFADGVVRSNGSSSISTCDYTVTPLQ